MAFSSKADIGFIRAKSVPCDPELFCITVIFPALSRSLPADISCGGRDEASRARVAAAVWPAAPVGRMLTSGTAQRGKACVFELRKYSILFLGY